MSVCVVGSLNVDLVARVDALPKPGETVLASGVSRHPGGKGLNQAIAAARAGARVRMVGTVGADEAGDWLLTKLAAAGVDAVRVLRRQDRPTGQAMIAVSRAGENTIVVSPGANAEAAPGPGAAAGARVLLAQLEIALSPLAKLFAQTSPGCVKLLNAAPAEPEGARLFAHYDILILNETELAAYARRRAPTPTRSEVALAARGLLAREGQSALVTLGADGALLVEASGEAHFPAVATRAVDTVGAGDCFCGVLAAALDEGLDLRAAIPRANAAAAIAVTRPGVSDAMPTRAEIDAAVASRRAC